MSDLAPPLLSIICPIRNMEGKLQNLKYWIEQIPERVEVILVCDESSDNTFQEIVRLVSIQSRKAQIRIISGVFQAPGPARNAGKEVAAGSWICFWDSDDIGYPNEVLETLDKKIILGDSTKVYCFGYEVVSSNGELIHWHGWNHSAKINSELVSLNPGLWRFCFAREVALSRDFSSLNMGEDQLFLVQVGLECLPIRFEEKVVYRYFKNVQGQLTASPHALKDLRKSIQFLKIEQELTPTNGTFVDRLLVRQSLTALKLADTELRVKALAVLLQVLMRNPALFLKQVHLILRRKTFG